MFKKSVYAVLAIILMLTVTYVVASFFRNRSVSIRSLPAKSFLLFDTGKQIISPPLIHESQLFAQTASSLYAIDLESQRLLWTRDTPTDDLHTIPLIVSDEILIAQGKDGKVIALMAKTGQFLWENQPQVYHGTETTLSDAWIEDTQIYNGTIYIARYSSYLTAYDFNSGEIRWSVDVPDRTLLVITIDSNNIFLTTSTSIIQFDIDSGRMLQEHSLGTRIHYALNEDDTFYFAKNSDEGISVFALDSLTFQEKWTTSAKTLSLSEFAGMIIDNGVLYISGDGLAAISTHDGQLLWKSSIKSRYGPPIVSSEKVYVQDRANIYAYDRPSGVLIGGIPIESDIPWSFRPNVKPTIVDNLLIVSTKNGQLYGYELED